MIPKTIHCCWFGGPKTPLAERCLASWRRFAPGWEIREWTLRDIGTPGESVPAFVRTAIARRKWAFVADWMRFNVLFAYGGLYLDADVELVAPLDGLSLENPFVAGEWCADGAVAPGPAVVCLPPASETARRMLDHYAAAPFDGMKTVGEVLTDLGIPILVLSPEAFSPIRADGTCRRTERTIGVHHYAMSWAGPRRRLARWLSWHGLRGLVDLALGIRNGGRAR